MYKQFYLFLFFFIYLASFIECNEIEIKTLKVDEHVFGESLYPGKDRIYKLVNLKPNTHYEIRISYQAFVCKSFISLKIRCQQFLHYV